MWASSSFVVKTLDQQSKGHQFTYFCPVAAVGPMHKALNSQLFRLKNVTLDNGVCIFLMHCCFMNAAALHETFLLSLNKGQCEHQQDRLTCVWNKKQQVYYMQEGRALWLSKWKSAVPEIEGRTTPSVINVGPLYLHSNYGKWSELICSLPDEFNKWYISSIVLNNSKHTSDIKSHHLYKGLFRVYNNWLSYSVSQWLRG